MNRIYHTWDKWECYPAGFYETKPPGDIEPKQAAIMYADFLRDDDRFREALNRVIHEWATSCEHYLSNENMNRIAWLGQAAACVALGLPRAFRGGFNTLHPAEQERANETALEYLNKWLAMRGEPALDLSAAKCKTQVELY